jgi:colicin import membrane protein
MTFRIYGEPHEDKRLRQMILISAVLHVVAIVWVIVGGSLFRSPQPRATAITVELVNPAALGTNLPNGGRGGNRVEGELSAPPKLAVPPVPPKQEVKPQPQEEKPPQPVARKEEPKPPPAPIQQKEAVKLPEKEKPVEKPPVKPEPEKAKVEEKKPEPKKIEPKPEPAKVAKTEEKKAEPKPELEKIPPKKVEEKKPEEKKLEPQKAEVKPQKPEGKPERTEVKPEVEKPPVKAAEKKSEEVSTKTEVASPEERERQISAALDRIKSQVQPKDEVGATSGPHADGPKSAGPITKGGEAGEGGGGAVRGIEFILYTQQLQRRVQESWIVTEKRPELVASVTFRIQSDGEVQDVELMKSSGDGAFDQSVLRAVRKAAPFPPPPQSYADEFATQKIFMNFGGEGRVN